MGKCDKTNRNISCVIYFFYCSQPVSTLNHSMEKRFCEDKILFKKSKKDFFEKKFNWWCDLSIYWIKIISWYPSVFNSPLYDLCNCRQLALSSPFRRYILSIGFGQAFVHLSIYISTQICASYFQTGFWGSSSLMIKPFGVSAYTRYTHLSLRISVIVVIFFNALFWLFLRWGILHFF